MNCLLETSQVARRPPSADNNPVIVAYLINQYPRASHSFIRREILALEAQGVTVHRFAIRPFAEVVDEADKAEEAKTHVLLKGGTLASSTLATLLTRPGTFIRALRLTIKVGRRSERGTLRHLVYLAEACVLVRELRARSVQHLHAHFGTNSATVAMLARELGGPPYSFTCHGPEEFDRPEALALDEKVARAAFTVAISSYGRSQLYRWTRAADWSRIYVVHCGVDQMFLDSARQAQGFSLGSSPRLVCVGRLCEQKGQLLLCRAAAQLAEEGLDFQITLVGDGPMRRDIEREIQRLDLGAHIKITGWMSNPQVRQQILESRALVLPSFAEGLPVVIMEALALGRPVISTYVAGIPELVENSVNGWLVPAGDVDSLARAMRQALEASPQSLEEMGRQGAARVAQQHDVNMEAVKLREHFQRSMGSPPASRDPSPMPSPSPVAVAHHA